MAEITNTSPQAFSREIGVIIKKGGIITFDVEQTSDEGFFKLLHVGTGGNVLVKGSDGQIIPFRGVLSGGWLPVLGNAVVSSATVDGVSLTTTASDIDWYGGM